MNNLKSVYDSYACGARKAAATAAGIGRKVDGFGQNLMGGLALGFQALQNDHQVRRPVLGAGAGMLLGKALGLPWWATGLLGAAGGIGGHMMHQYSGDGNMDSRFMPHFKRPFATNPISAPVPATRPRLSDTKAMGA